MASAADLRPRALLLLENRENVRLLTDFLRAQIDVIPDVRSALLENLPFDICFVDAASLVRHRDWVESRREQEQPKFLPFLMLGTPRDLEQSSFYLGRAIDDMLAVPIRKHELQARVNVMLRARNLSLENEQLYQNSQDDVIALKREQGLRENFVSMLSHDLRTPLTTAKMNAQMLERKLGAMPELKNQASRIANNMDRADRMITDLLDATRLKRGETLPQTFEVCDLTQVASETLEDLSVIYGPRFPLKFQSPVTASVSPAGIRRVLENLCHNSVKYGESGKPVTVTLRDMAESIEIDVHNEGAPISEKDQANLFDPFRRTESAKVSGQAGWGLGLALVRGITEAHGGHVKVRSSPSEGTCFTVILPRSPEL